MAIKVYNKDIVNAYSQGKQLNKILSYNKIAWQRGESKPNYFCITNLYEGTNEFLMLQSGTPSVTSIEYSRDGETWTQSSPAYLSINMNPGEKIYIRGTQGVWCNPKGLFVRIRTRQNAKVSGDILTLLNYKNPPTSLSTYCFRNLFIGGAMSQYDTAFQGISDASELILPKFVSTYCYDNMFNYCTNLVKAPKLPATELAPYCYLNMFWGCSSLTTAPELPATTLEQGCYLYMFYNCSSLETAPVLPATTIVNNCYNSMFLGCTKLNHVTSLITTPNATYTGSWLSGVSSTGTFIKAPNANWARSTSGIPSGWTVQEFIPTSITNVRVVTAPVYASDLYIDVSYTLVDDNGLEIAGGKRVPILPNETGHEVTRTVSVTDFDITFDVEYVLSAEENMQKLPFYVENASSAAILLKISKNSNSAPSLTLEYSRDGANWTNWGTTSTSEMSLSIPYGLKVYIRNTSYNSLYTGNQNYYNQFISSGKLNIGGNIMSMLGLKFENMTTLEATYTFYGLLLLLSGVTDASKLVLPATKLTLRCYYWMFTNCKNLIAVPKLPATLLAEYCYANMFLGCTSLKEVPSDLLPATTLSNYCYTNMFYGCTSLTKAPNLPATTLSNYCYNLMFSGCTSLTESPFLPAATLVSNCYNGMFQSCSKLNYIKAMFKTTPSGSYTSNWVTGVASSGTFIKHPSATWNVVDTYGVPQGWNVLYFQPIRVDDIVIETNPIYADDTKIKISYKAVDADGNKVSVTQQIDIPENETGSLVTRTVSVVLASITFDVEYTQLGEEHPMQLVPLYFENVDNSPVTLGMTRVSTSYNQTMYTSRDGENWTLWGETGYRTLSTTIPVGTRLYVRNLTNKGYFNNGSANNRFTSSGGKVRVGGNIMSLAYVDFEDKVTLTKNYEYGSLFNAMSNLVDASKLVLPATTLTTSCYSSMFYNCSSLTKAPKILPATQLVSSCYHSMFSGCSALTETPVLPATKLAVSCYSYMFSRCSSLTTAPALPATELAAGCYGWMFQSCISLTTAPELPAETLYGNGCYQYMFSGCSKLTLVPDVLPATTLTENCYYWMFLNCTSLTEAPALPATTLANSCYFSMFYGCTELVKAPELPAPNLVTTCYNNMFYGCSKLNYIKALFITTPTTNYTYDWVKNIPSKGTFVKSKDATWNVTGTYGVPSGWIVETI